MSDVSSQSGDGGWARAVATDYLGTVLAVTDGELITAYDEGSPGRFYVGEWQALFVPAALLDQEFDPDIVALVRLRYARFTRVSITSRPLARTATLRVGESFEIVGARKAIQVLHSAWRADIQFGESAKDPWG
jgi:hypothetical protein